MYRFMVRTTGGQRREVARAETTKGAQVEAAKILAGLNDPQPLVAGDLVIPKQAVAMAYMQEKTGAGVWITTDWPPPPTPPRTTTIPSKRRPK